MKKNDNLSNYKYKLSFNILNINTISEIKGGIQLYDHYFTLKMVDYLSSGKEEKQVKREIIKNILIPLHFSEAEESFYINYALVKAVKLSNSKIISLELYNPICPNSITINLFKLESIGMIMNKTVAHEGLLSIVNYISGKINSETKVLIEQFLIFFNVLKGAIENWQYGINGNLLLTLEERITKSILHSKKFFDKNIEELKIKEKMKNDMNKKLCRTKDKAVVKSMVESQNIQNESIKNSTHYKGNNPTTPQFQGMSGSMSKHSASFEEIIFELRFKSFTLIKDSIWLFFQICSLEFGSINLKKIKKTNVSNNIKYMNEVNSSNMHNFTTVNNLNLSHNNIKAGMLTEMKKPVIENKHNKSFNLTAIKKDKMSPLDRLNLDNNHSTKTNSMKDSEKIQEKEKNVETPKFCKKSLEKSNTSNNLELPLLSHSQVAKKIEEAKETHLFLPTSSFVNVFNNLVEFVHRKYFDSLFDDFFKNLFFVERDSNNLIKLESLFNYYLFLRGLKNFLFTDKNKISFSNTYFYDDN